MARVLRRAFEYYENGALGLEYENMLLSCEAGRNSIWSYFPQLRGAGYELRRSTLFSTVNPDAAPQPMDKEDTRKWFRPSDVMVGADGAIYIADFYDPFIGGHRMLEPNGAGTIYRITRKGDNPQAPVIDLGETGGQIKALKSPNHSVRYAGFKRLTDQPTQLGVIELLKLSRDENPRVVARALYALAKIGVKTGLTASLKKVIEDRVSRALEASDPEIRITAYRALRQQDPGGLVVRAIQLADDSSIAVRREVALSLRDIPLVESKDIILELINGFEGQDRWLLEAIGTACEGKEEAIWNALSIVADKDPLLWSKAFTAITWRLHPTAAIAGLMKRALSDGLTPADRRQAMDALAFIPSKDAGEAVLAAAIDGPEDTRAYAAWWINARSTNYWEAYGLEDELPPDPTAEALAVEARRMTVGRNKLKAATELTDEIRETAIEMAVSPIGAPNLLHLAGRNELPGFVYLVVAQHIHENPDVSVRALASRYFPKPGTVGQVLPPMGDIASLTGNIENGRELFFGRAACATCHLHGEEGRDIGPNLTVVGERFDRTAILDSIMNPSAAIAFGYESVLVETTDGSALSGFVVGDGETVILKDIGGQIHSIPQSNIRNRSELDQSIMPSGASLGLAAQDLADLVSYLTGNP